MKILFYQNKASSLDIVSDGVHVLETLNNLTKLGHTVIFTNGEYYNINKPPLAKVTRKPLKMKHYWLKIKKFIRESSFRGEALIGFLFLKELGLFISACITIMRHKPDLIYRRHNMFDCNCILSKIFKIPSITEINGIVSDEVEVQKRGDRFSVMIINRIEKWDFKLADKYISVTFRLKNVINIDFKVPMDKIVVIENGANVDLFKPLNSLVVKKDLGLNPESTYICFVGGLEIWHGLKYFISAMPKVLNEYPNARALIVGEGPEKNNLLIQSAQLSISDKITFTGRVPYEKVPQYINASEICIAPFSTDRCLRIGSSSLKLCEYLACAKPVISSRSVGLEFIEENNIGVLVHVGSSEELSEALIKLLGDSVLRQNMGENGRKYVLENRSWESLTRKVADVCNNTIDEFKRQLHS